jgi:hypothetical protein
MYQNQVLEGTRPDCLSWEHQKNVSTADQSGFLGMGKQTWWTASISSPIIIIILLGVDLVLSLPLTTTAVSVPLTMVLPFLRSPRIVVSTPMYQNPGL